ncbi:helix-turn-helix domain-containing protein [Prosthecochloris sp. CIB 2401]|uniref:helix-turn-helix domain-containing protein n=1 Tax=Prosthecochloris sp. CIB 2401 TaxID=1868325 RepID=UPI00080AAC4D|nr:transcriptional regulator [Prosthecochloris sp. CIB 2401]ANT65464.1 putative transcriptional regulator [Prosthecochloris sp. CIB 2401]
MSEAGSKLIKSARQALAYARGEVSAGFIAHVPDEVDVKAIRMSLGLTQPEFSNRFGFDVRAVQDWEQKRRQPDRAARVLLTVIAREPDAVRRALGDSE